MTIKLRLMLLLQFVVSVAYSESFRYNSIERVLKVPEYSKDSIRNPQSQIVNKPLTVHIPVTLPYNKINADFGIEKVQLSITHPYISDIKVVLKGPQSAYVYFDHRPGHEHYHADNFVSYKLAKVNPEISDHTKWQVIGEGVKASFCIWNLGYCQDELDNCYDSNCKNYLVNNITNYRLGGKYRACDDTFQGLSVGGIDSYGQDYEEQSIEIPINTEKGEYALIIEVDTNNEYKEMTKVNNLYIHKLFIN